MSHVVARLNRTLVGRYELEHELGQGGMSTVFRAKDLRHGRQVALKVLRPELAALVGADRFLAEIRTTANLQHPNILPLHDSGEADSFLFYVMPFVDGESLRKRLEREGQLPVDEAVRITTDVADALQSAHDQGVIHRDVKPENILLSRGRPLVADFGIALAVSVAGEGRRTEAGLSMGTPSYMSPEQATADRVPDARSDVYSLGCVLYEMLLGEPPYTGSSAQSVLAKILTQEVARPSVVRPSIPPNVDAAVRRALEKLPADRFSSMRAFAAALTDPSFRYGEEVTPASPSESPRRRTAERFAWVATAIALVGLGWASANLRGPRVVSNARMTIPFESGQGFAPGTPWLEFDIAPDGRGFVYVGPGGAGGTRLWRRTFDEVDPYPLPATQDAVAPTFSPDGENVLFFEAGGLSVMPLTGGPPVRILEDGGFGGTAWSDDGWVYLAHENGLARVPASGGELETVIAAPRTGEYRWPDALPGGRAILATLTAGPPALSRIVAISVSTGQVTELASGTMARYAASGHLAYVTSDGTLMAARFDARRLRLDGPGVPILGGIEVKGGSATMFSIAENGALLYRSGPAQTGFYKLVWVERDGTVTAVDSTWTFDASSPGSGGNNELGVALSPDGRRVALKVRSPDTGEDIYVKELDRGPLSRITFHEGIDRRPRWSRDGEWILFNSDRGGNRDIWRRRANATGVPELVLDLERPIFEVEISPDEEWYVLRLGGTANVTGGRDLVGLRRGDTTVVPLATEAFDEKAAALSPDGRWLAYESTETGGDEIYVRPFPDVAAGKWQVSTAGGIAPRWSRSGDELFYIAGDRRMTAARVSTDGGVFFVEERIPLFNVDERALSVTSNWATYDVAPDGRFLAHQFDIHAPVPRRLVLVTNWFQDLEARVGR